jgi:hypothetical protein
MGIMCSWAAIKTEAKSEVLDYLGLVETGIMVQPASGEKDMSVHQSGDGWLFIFAEDFDWATAKRGLELSRFGLTLTVQTEDKVSMECVVRAAEHGEALWSVSHVNEPGKLLEVTGNPPEGFEAIRREYEKMQAEEDGVDALHEIPVALSRHVTGFNVYEDPIDFEALAGTKPSGSEGTGLVARMMRLFRGQ